MSELTGASGASRRGPGRHRNDDRWAVAAGNGTVLLAVADGMGFTAGGGTAATIALRAVLDATAEDESEPTGSTPARDDVLGAAMVRAHRAVRAAGPPTMPETIRPGTTLTAALVAGDRLHLAHAGDSSCWLYRDGVLRRLTDVHTSAAVLVAAGAVDGDSEAARRLDNLLTRYLGMPGLLQPQVCTVPLRAGDRLLLASDGVTRAVPPPALCALLARPHVAAADVIAAAVAGACNDDVTAVLATVGADYPTDAEVRSSSATGEPPGASVGDGQVLASGR
jgi:PPM family protein phosphatase